MMDDVDRAGDGIDAATPGTGRGCAGVRINPAGPQRIVAYDGAALWADGYRLAPNRANSRSHGDRHVD